jgi:hypothetical protein
MGKTIFRRIPSCDTVITGAFFPQSDLYVPEKKVREHAG